MAKLTPREDAKAERAKARFLRGTLTEKMERESRPSLRNIGGRIRRILDESKARSAKRSSSRSSSRKRSR